jgi:hypothetical protein
MRVSDLKVNSFYEYSMGAELMLVKYLGWSDKPELKPITAIVGMRCGTGYLFQWVDDGKCFEFGGNSIASYIHRAMTVDECATSLLDSCGGKLTKGKVNKFFKHNPYSKDRQLIEQKAKEFLAELDNDNDFDPAGGRGLHSHI